MDVFDSGLQKFRTEDVLAESTLVTPRGFPHISDDPDARCFQLLDIHMYVHSLIAEGVEVQALVVAAITRAGDRITKHNGTESDAGSPFVGSRGEQKANMIG